MATTIRATCPDCGDISLTPADVDLRTCTPTPDRSSYHFTCPQCMQMIDKAAPSNVIALLVSGGVKPHPWTIPAEWFEPKIGPPLTYDDILDLVLVLENDSYLSFMANESTLPRKPVQQRRRR
jgi:hypothetical protein